jgi:hypothetical protein
MLNRSESVDSPAACANFERLEMDTAKYFDRLSSHAEREENELATGLARSPRRLDVDRED